MAVPRVCGRTPMWRLRPALPTVRFWWSELPTTPTVARHSARTTRISPEGRRSVAMPPSLAISWMPTPAERPSWPPRPGWSSTLWISVPTGISDSGIALATVGVAAARLLEPLDEGLLRLGLRDLREVRVGDEAPARRRGLGLADRHY